MNQKIAPSGALCAGPVASAGMPPVPAAVAPWHEAQCRANKFAPACAAARLPAYGFFICSAVAGAPWKEAVWALIGEHRPIVENKNADTDPINADLLLLQLALLAAFKLPSQTMVDIFIRAQIPGLLPAFSTHIILHRQIQEPKAAESATLGARVNRETTRDLLASHLLDLG
jgi:hypothetical protein